MLLIFFFNDTATTEIYTLSLHDALPISRRSPSVCCSPRTLNISRHRFAIWSIKAPIGRRYRSSNRCHPRTPPRSWKRRWSRSEEHTSELQSRQYLVCRLLLEKKKTIYQV